MLDWVGPGSVLYFRTSNHFLFGDKFRKNKSEVNYKNLCTIVNVYYCQFIVDRVLVNLLLTGRGLD